MICFIYTIVNTVHKSDDVDDDDYGNDNDNDNNNNNNNNIGKCHRMTCLWRHRGGWEVADLSQPTRYFGDRSCG